MACSQVIGCMDNALDGKIIEGKRASKVAILLFKVFIKWLTLNQILSQLQIPRTKTPNLKIHKEYITKMCIREFFIR